MELLKCEVLTSDTSKGLEKEFDKWIVNNKDMVIVFMQFSTSSYGIGEFIQYSFILLYNKQSMLQKPKNMMP